LDEEDLNNIDIDEGKPSTYSLKEGLPCLPIEHIFIESNIHANNT